MRIMHQGMNYKYQLDQSSNHYFVSDHTLEDIYNDNLEKYPKYIPNLDTMTKEELDRELFKGYKNVIEGKGKDFDKVIEDMKKKYNF